MQIHTKNITKPHSGMVHRHSKGRAFGSYKIFASWHLLIGILNIYLDVVTMYLCTKKLSLYVKTFTINLFLESNQVAQPRKKTIVLCYKNEAVFFVFYSTSTNFDVNSQYCSTVIRGMGLHLTSAMSVSSNSAIRLTRAYLRLNSRYWEPWSDFH